MGAPELEEKSENKGLEFRITEVVNQAGSAQSLARGVLVMVAHRNYEHALKEITTFVEMKAEYSEFESATEKFVERAAEFMSVIEEKRDAPGQELMSMAKRQALHDEVINNFKSLRAALKKIESTEYSMRMADLRSTLIVVKTFSWCVLAVLVLAFVIDVYTGLLSTTGSVADELIGDAASWTFDKLGL